MRPYCVSVLGLGIIALIGVVWGWGRKERYLVNSGYVARLHVISAVLLSMLIQRFKTVKFMLMVMIYYSKNIPMADVRILIDSFTHNEYEPRF